MEFPREGPAHPIGRRCAALEGSAGEGVLHRLLLQRPGKRGPAQDLGALYRQRPPVWHGCGDHLRRRPGGPAGGKGHPPVQGSLWGAGRRAEAKGVRLAIENCPMDGTWHKATCNIGFNPKAWEMMFDAVPSRPLAWSGSPPTRWCSSSTRLPQLEVGRTACTTSTARTPPSTGTGCASGASLALGSSRNPDAGLRRHRLAGRVPHPLSGASGDLVVEASTTPL